MPSKSLDQCGIPHATQQGDIAFLVANGQKGPRANIYRSKRDVTDRQGRITNSMVAQDMEVCWMVRRGSILEHMVSFPRGIKLSSVHSHETLRNIDCSFGSRAERV